MARQLIMAEETRYDYGLEGLEEYLWDGSLTREEIREKAGAIMDRVAEAVNKGGEFQWDLTHGILFYDDSTYRFWEDAIEEFSRIRKDLIQKTTLEMEEAERCASR